MKFRRAARRAADVDFTYSRPDQPVLTRAVIRTLEFIGGQRELERRYLAGREAVAAGEDFYAMALRLLAVDVDFDAAALDRVPRDGPVLFVSNHPYGVLDGIAFTALAMRVRPDFKILANGVLCALPETRAQMLPVDFAETDAARRTTLASRLAAQKWLQAGHAVGIFPAGGISTSEKPLDGPALDLPWAPFAAKLAMGARATIVPFYFEGQNSRLFQIASHLSLTLRLSLLFRETAKRMGTRLGVRIGRPIAHEEWQVFATREALLAEMRRRTFDLAPAGGTRLGRVTTLKVVKPAVRGAARGPAAASEDHHDIRV